MADAEFNGEETLLIKVCKFLGYTVLLNTFIDKIPQNYNIVSSGSTAGICMFSVALEMTAYTSMLTYQFAMDYPIHTFMENFVMVFQDWLLLGIILYYRDLLTLKVIPYVIVYTIVYTAVGMYWLPEMMMIAVMYLTTPLLCWSKVRQLVEILIKRDPGQLSSLTWFLVCYDTAALGLTHTGDGHRRPGTAVLCHFPGEDVRMFTTAMITKDIPMFVNLSSSEVLNLSIFFSIIYYNAIKKRPRRRSSHHRDR